MVGLGGFALRWLMFLICFCKVFFFRFVVVVFVG